MTTLTFLGAAQTVTGSRHLLTTAAGKKILVDAGLFQGRKELRERNWAAWAGGKLFIVQARPITALPGPLPRLSRLARVMASLMAEMLPVRPYPLEVTTWGPGLVISALLGPMVRMCGLALRVDRLPIIVRVKGDGPV